MSQVSYCYGNRAKACKKGRHFWNNNYTLTPLISLQKQIREPKLLTGLQQPLMLNLAFSIVMLLEKPVWACCTLLLESLVFYIVLCSYRNDNVTEDAIAYVYQAANERLLILFNFDICTQEKGKRNPIEFYSCEINVRFSSEYRATFPSIFNQA